MTQTVPAALVEKRKSILKYLGMALSALMVLTVLTVFALILRNESAHDEAKCPFVPLSERAFEGGTIYEESRSCVNGIAEHRYMLARAGKPRFELARKRMSADRFDAARYRWELGLDQQKRVVLSFFLEHKPAGEFREEDAVPR